MKPVPWLLALAAASGCLGGTTLAPATPEDPLVVATTLLPEIQEILDAVGRGESSVVSSRMVGRISGFETPTDVTLRLRPSEVLNGSTWFMVEDRLVEAPLFGLLEGEIEGRPDTEARLAWTPEWARGVILADETLQFVFIGRSPHRAPPVIYNLPTTTTGLSMGLPYDLDEESPNAEDCQRLQPDLSAPTVSNGRFDGPLYMMRTIMDGDALFASAHGDDAFPLLAAYLNDVDAIFENEFGLRLRLAGAHLHLDERRIPPQENPLGPLATYWNNRTHLARDLVHLFTGRPQYGAQANCIGGAGNPEVAYTFVPAIYGDRDANSALVTTAHEMGHILGGHHHYGNLAEGEGATIMLHSYLPGNRPIFGTVERSVIRAWVVNHFQPWDGSGPD